MITGNNTHSNSNRKKTFAFITITSNGIDEFQSQLTRGMMKAAQEEDVHVITLSFISTANPQTLDDQFPMILDFLDHFNLDGIMFLGWPKQFQGKSLENFKNRYHNIPLFSVGSGKDNIPSIYFDGNSYVSELLEHLIRDHKRKRIVFIPPYYYDTRVDTYIKIMKNHGIYDPSLLLDSNVLQEIPLRKRPEKIVQLIFDELKLKPDAVFFIYNYEAVRTIPLIKKRGFHIPEDIAVVAFEDSEASIYLTPGLTAIVYPWYDLGYNTLKLFTDMIKKKKYYGTHTVSSKIIYRQSCGCNLSGKKDTGYSEQQIGLYKKYGTSNIRQRDLNFEIHALGQALITSFNMERILDTLEQNLYKTTIKSIVIYLNSPEIYPVREITISQDKPYNKELFFYEKGKGRIKRDLIFDYNLSIEKFYSDSRRRFLYIQPLNIQNQFLGMVIFEPGPLDLWIYQSLATQLTTSIQSAMLVEKLNNTVNKLQSENSLRQKREQELHYIARYDPLTKLLNRHSFYHVFNILAAEHETKAGSFGYELLFLDIDKFKPVNDLYGHDYGDRLLTQIADRLQHYLHDVVMYHSFNHKKTDDKSPCIFRFGGDEFTIILKKHEKKTVDDICRNLIKMIEKPFSIKEKTLYISCSIGISSFPKDERNPNLLLKFADIAMYRAKQSRQSYEFFDRIKDTHYLEQLTLENDLKRSMQEKQIEPHYQILYNAKREIIGIEALLRWNHPERGVLLPGDFIDLAEKENLMISIGTYILEQSCSHLKQIHKNGFGELFILVNCTSTQVYDPDFITLIQKTLRKYSLKSSQLKLGLKEIFILKDPKRFITIIKHLSTIGIQFAIDGFGSEKSLLQFLIDVPENTIIKIGKYYTYGIEENNRKKEFLNNILHLLSSLGIRAIISGIETKEQHTYLCSQISDGINHIYQGLLYNKPAEFESIMKLLVK